MFDPTTKLTRLAALRPLSPEPVASLAAAWKVRMESPLAPWRGHSARRLADQFIDLNKLIPNLPGL